MSNQPIQLPAPVKQVEFRDVPGFPGYRVGDDGSVWSQLKISSTGKSGMGRRIAKGEWVRLALTEIRNGRMTVNICRGGKVCKRYVHRLVLESFVGPCPRGMECCHYPDRSPSNCNLPNLRWDTKRANAEDKRKHGTMLIGAENPKAKLNESDVKEIRKLKDSGTAVRSIAKRFKVHKNTIYFICNRSIWGHVA